jgi:adenylate cyclase
MPHTTLKRVTSFFGELKRRRVFRATAVYVAFSFAALEGASILVPALHIADWTMTVLVVLALAGLPVTLGLAWVFDVSRSGITRTPDVGGADSAGPIPGVAGGGPGAPRPAGAAGGSARGETLPAPESATDRRRKPSPIVAVVPFLNLSGGEENEYFADGITEDVIAHLSKIRALKVISRTSVMPFKARGQSLREIGAQLGATTLLDGSVRRVGDRVRIVAELLDAKTDEHLWAETYDRQLTDIFSIQTDVAMQIVSALRTELSPDEQARIETEPTSNLEAYQLYLKGRHLLIRYTVEGLRRAIDYFRLAIDRDPDYALAYASIAMAYAELGEAGAMPAEALRSEAWEAGQKAVHLDPRLAEAHCAVAHLKCLWEFDWGGAEAQFQRALELCPSSADAYDLYGRMCAALGRFDEAVALHRRAQELDPLAHRLDVATTLLRAGRYAEAEVEARRAAEFEPDHDRARATLGWALFKQGNLEAGLTELEWAVEASPDSVMWRAQLGQALALADREPEAREILRKLEDQADSGFVSPYHLAYIHTGLGEHDRAMDLLERAFEERIGPVYGLKGSFLFAPLRPHPRFQALMARMNL